MTDKPTSGAKAAIPKPNPVDEGQASLEKEALRTLPPEAQKVVGQLLVSRSVGPVPNPLLEKLNANHITEILELSRRRGDREFENGRAGRRYRMAYIVIWIVAFFVLTFYMLPIDRDLYKQVVQLLIAVGGGFGVGYGVRHWKG